MQIENCSLQIVIDDDRVDINTLCNRAYSGDVGIDMQVWNPDRMLIGYIIPARQMSQLATGVRIKIPDGMWGSLRPRSSSFIKRGLIVMEGTIDPGYTGEMFVVVYNPSDKDVLIHNGTRLAQLVVIHAVYTEVKVVEELPTTERANNGFGSSGV